MVVLRFSEIGVDVNGAGKRPVLAVMRAGDSPRFGRGVGHFFHFGEGYRLHNLTEQTVAQNADGRAVFVRLVKGIIENVDCLLNGAGSVSQKLVVAVSAALDRLKIVALRSKYSAETGTAAHHVDDDAGQLGARYVGNALLLQAYAGAGAAGHGSRACTCRAVNHVDSRHFAFRLNEVSADLADSPAHVFGNFVLRGDGIAEEISAAASDCGFGNGFVALHQFFLAHYLSTSKMLSGHMWAQAAQPTQASGSVHSTT